MRRWVWVSALGLGACLHAGPPRAPRDEALEDLQQGRAQRALPILEALLGETPEDLTLARAVAEGYSKSGRAGELVTRLEADSGARTRASGLYLLALAHFAVTANAEPAATDLRAAIALAPRLAELHYRLGLLLVDAERFADALGPLQQAAQLAPEREGIALPLAKALARSGRKAEAIAALRRMLTQHPTAKEVHTGRRLMDSIADALAVVPLAARTRLDEGLNQMQDSGDPQRAIVAFEDIVHDYPDLAGVHALLGLAYQKADDAGLAVDELKHALQLAPDDGRSYFYLGQVYAAHQRPAQAFEALQKAVALHPFLDEAYFQLGDLALDRKDLPTARAAFDAFTTLQPDSIPGHGKLAWALQASGDYSAADRELKAVLDKEPENTEFMLRMGLLYTDKAAHTKQREEHQAANAEASRWLEEVLRRQPENAVAARALESLKAH